MQTPSAESISYEKTLAFVPTRDELPAVLNARKLFGCGVEVGVQRGLFSEHILQNWKGAHLISVDPWAEDATGEYIDIANRAQSDQEALFAETCERLSPFISRCSVWRLTSVEASEMVPHHSLDFVYLDARHDYASVMDDLESWYDKVRPGGILAGHDYVNGTAEAGVFGVKVAVDEFFAERGIVVYATTRDTPWVSWMVEIPVPGAKKELVDISTVTIAFESAGVKRQVQLKLDPAQMSQKMMLDSLAQNQIYEPETCALLMSVLRDGDTFIDVGTHVGFFSTIAASIVGSSGHVVSFEPEERNFRQLEEHVALNGFQNVKPVNAAVGAKESTAVFWVNADNDGGHALWDVGLHGFNAKSREMANRREVPVTTLDSHFSSRDAVTPKLIKIDVEGSELRVLQGAEALLRRKVPYVVCEINHFALEQMGATEDALRSYMTELGYEANAINPETGEIIALSPDQHVESKYVFNLFFRHHSAEPVLSAA